MFDASQDLIAAADAANARMGAAQRDLLALIAAIDRAEAWQGDGARDIAHWVGMRYGIAAWKAHRWVAAAHALVELPTTAEALGSGRLGIDKVVELTRFATAETERGLVRWAATVSCGAIRRRGDLLSRPELQEDRDAERDRSLSWWYADEGRRWNLQAELPAATGAIVVRAIERMAAQVPESPDDDVVGDASARRADALVALCSARIAADPDPDRATVVVHAQLAGLVTGSGGAELEGGPVIHPETVRRLLCNARVQTVIENEAGDAIGVGRLTREPAAWMVRQIRHRDRECRFPGCGARAFTEAHHISFWRHGGRTDLDNLVLICSFHHKLVHELGWRLTREGRSVRWFRPDGRVYRAGPSPGLASHASRSLELETA
jgi:Domain of unknown function (DUF222)/HNH endonuclease